MPTTRDEPLASRMGDEGERSPTQSGLGALGRFFGRRWWPWLLAVVVPFMALWKLGSSTVFDWDEAQPGQIAFEMVRSHDYLSYAYQGQVEDAFAKPPLSIWCIAASYRLLGFNELALRLPAALAAILVVLAMYKTVRLYAARGTAVLAALVLVSSRGLLGWHVGRTGDTDALLIAGQAWFAYGVLRALDHSRRAGGMVLAALSLGVAFWSKGIACITIPAGVGLYVLASGRLRTLLTWWATWMATGLFGGFLLAWYLLAPILGPPLTGGHLPGPTLWSTTMFHDTFSRIVENVEGHGSDWQPYDLLSMLESLWMPWVYLLVLALIGLVAPRWRRMAASWRTLRRSDDPLPLVCVCLSLPLAVAMVAMRSKLTWYAAPLVPYLSILLVVVLERLGRRHRATAPTFAVILVATLAYQFVRLSTPVRDESCLVVKAAAPALAAAERVLVDAQVAQRQWLTLSWTGAKLTLTRDPSSATDAGTRTMLVGSPAFIGRFPPSEVVVAAPAFEIRRLH